MIGSRFCRHGTSTRDADGDSNLAGYISRSGGKMAAARAGRSSVVSYGGIVATVELPARCPHAAASLTGVADPSWITSSTAIESRPARLLVWSHHPSPTGGSKGLTSLFCCSAGIIASGCITGVPDSGDVKRDHIPVVLVSRGYYRRVLPLGPL
ncbi:unnamed protein product [Lampetra fluviatilis]